MTYGLLVISTLMQELEPRTSECESKAQLKKNSGLVSQATHAKTRLAMSVLHVGEATAFPGSSTED